MPSHQPEGSFGTVESLLFSFFLFYKNACRLRIPVWMFWIISLHVMQNMLPYVLQNMLLYIRLCVFSLTIVRHQGPSPLSSVPFLEGPPYPLCLLLPLSALLHTPNPYPLILPLVLYPPHPHPSGRAVPCAPPPARPPDQPPAAVPDSAAGQASSAPCSQGRAGGTQHLLSAFQSAQHRLQQATSARLSAVPIIARMRLLRS